MAQKTVLVLEDDIDGGPADETVTFSFDGVSYEIDLNAKNADRFRDAMSLYTGSARRLGRRGPARPASRPVVRATTRRAARNGTSRDIRSWALANGMEVNERGRIPADIVAAYEKASR